MYNYLLCFDLAFLFCHIPPFCFAVCHLRNATDIALHKANYTSLHYFFIFLKFFLFLCYIIHTKHMVLCTGKKGSAEPFFYF